MSNAFTPSRYRDMRHRGRQTPRRYNWRRFNASATGQTVTASGNVNVNWDGGDRYMQSADYYTHSTSVNPHLVTFNSIGEHLVLVKLALLWSSTSPVSASVQTLLTGYLLTNGLAPLQNGTCSDVDTVNVPGPHVVDATPYNHFTPTITVAAKLILHTIIDVEDDLINGELYVNVTAGAIADGAIAIQDTESSFTIIKLEKDKR